MRSIYRFLAVVAFIGISQVLPSGRVVCQDTIGVELENLITTRKLPAAINLARAFEPQYPISLGSFDGVYYYYSTDCCVDGDIGILLSTNPGLTLGCPGPDPGNPVEPIELELPPAFFGNAAADGANNGAGEDEGEAAPADEQAEDVSKKCYLFIDSAMKATRMPRVFRPLNDNDELENEYGDGPLGTAIALVDQDGEQRFFTLVRYKKVRSVKVTNPDGSKSSADVTISFPLLTLSRPASFRRIDFGQGGQGFGIPARRIPPLGSINVPGVDFSQNVFSVVELPLPDPQNPNVDKVQKCVLINRPN